jgi:pyridoxal phosphate enzyme (YggS family)
MHLVVRPEKGEPWPCGTLDQMVETIGTAQKIAARAALLRARIDDAARRAGRDPSAVTLIAVTKTMSVETIRAAALAGIRDIGENKVQEASLKHGELLDQAELRWHLIGHLQRNKVRRAIETFSTIQSVDSLELATTLSAHVVARGRTLDVFAQVNVSGEAEKSGFPPSRFVEQAGLLADLPGLHWRGLMTIAPEGADEATLRAVFRGTRQLCEETAGTFDPTLWNGLSMGMSNDFEIAVEEGATHVRVGRAIFGERTETVQV